MSSIPSPAPRDREHRFARPHLVIVSTLEELRSLEIGCPDLRTGAAHSDIFTSFLRVLERFQVLLKTPTSSREHREKFTKNYKQLIAGESIGYLADVILASLKPLGPMIVNGTKYESDADVILKADVLRNAWEKTLDAIHDDRQISFLRTGLLMEFDKAYVDFEKAYVSFLIHVESSCKSILLEGNALVALIDNGCTEVHKDLVTVLQKLNSAANIVGKGRQDLDYSIYAGAIKLSEAGHLPAMCGRVLNVYERAARYFEKLSEPDALDRVDPNLQRNSDLVDILAEWEEAWELAMPYVHSIHLQESLEAFIHAVLAVANHCPEFKEACLTSDVEALLILPQLLAAFCANHEAEAAELLKVAGDLSLEAAGLPDPTVNLDDLFYDLAKGEILSNYCDCGMRLQRTNALVWNKFSKLLWAELMDKFVQQD